MMAIVPPLTPGISIDEPMTNPFINLIINFPMCQIIEERRGKVNAAAAGSLAFHVDCVYNEIKSSRIFG
jgi:hypothetical protein